MVRQVRQVRRKRGGNDNEPVSALQSFVKINNTKMRINEHFDAKLFEVFNLGYNIVPIDTIGLSYLNNFDIINKDGKKLVDYKQPFKPPVYYILSDNSQMNSGCIRIQAIFRIPNPEKMDTVYKAVELTIADLHKKMKDIVYSIEDAQKIYESDNGEYIIIYKKYMYYMNLQKEPTTPFNKSLTTILFQICHIKFDIIDNFSIIKDYWNVLRKHNFNPDQRWYCIYSYRLSKIRDSVKTLTTPGSFSRFEPSIIDSIFSQSQRNYTRSYSNTFIDKIIQTAISKL